MPHDNPGTKKPTAEEMAYWAHLANLQSLKINTFSPYNQRETAKISNTSSQDLDHVLTNIGNVYLVLQSVSATENTNAATRIELSTVRGVSEYTLTRQNISTANLSCDWNGNVILTPDDKIRAKFVSGTSTNEIELVVQGYTIQQ